MSFCSWYRFYGCGWLRHGSRGRLSRNGKCSRSRDSCTLNEHHRAATLPQHYDARHSCTHTTHMPRAHTHACVHTPTRTTHHAHTTRICTYHAHATHTPRARHTTRHDTTTCTHHSTLARDA